MVIEHISISDLCMAENLDVAFFLVFQTLLVSSLRQKQTGAFSFPAHRGVMRQHIKNNHVPGVLRKSLEVHVVMAVVVLRSGFLAHFLQQLTDCFAFWHKTHFLSVRMRSTRSFPAAGQSRACPGA